MKKIILRQWPLLIFLLFYFLIAFFTYKSYGISIDEPDEYLRGKLLYNKARGNDKVLQEDFVIKKQDNQDLLDHNHLHHALLYVFNGKESFEEYHLLNLIFASLIFIAIYEILLINLRRQSIAILGTIFLFFTPRFTGDIPSNPKDTIFGVYYFLSLSLIYISASLKWDEKVKIIVLGVIFGLTQALRVLGYALYPIYFIYAILTLKMEKKNIIKSLLNLLLEMVLIFFVSYLVHIISLPYLGADPFWHFWELIKVSARYGWPGKVLFFGNFVLASKLPWTYLPVWILITTPIFIIILFTVSLLNFNVKNKLFILFALSLVINFFVFFVTRPTIYDGLRHMIYLVPQIVLMSIFGLTYLLSKKGFRIAVMILLLISLLMVAKDYIELHPYQYIYFNKLAGGLKNARGKFETDYWGESNIEAAKWIRGNVIKSNLKIYTCGNEAAIIYYLPEAKAVKNAAEADYAVCWERMDDYKNIKGRIVHTISRQATPLTYIFKIKE